MDLSCGARLPARGGVGRLGILVLLAVIGSGLVSCGGLTRPWQAPEVALVAVRPHTLGLARQVFLLTLAVRNPNDRTLPINAMTYRLALEGEEVGRGGGALERQIPPHGESRLEVEVVADLLALAQRLPMLLRTDRPLDWAVTGSVTLAGGAVTLPYRYSGQLDPADLTTRRGTGSGR
ncbi:LEA type 2 family protein [Thiocystis violacea]|uniref:LEA type 2 family protein n=1 Tax=Thiocystis violacea TaxID=13725 RepID=UPI001F5BAF7B|nr:LEA type 2 family protein [Thiocystis violacea]